MNKLFAAHLALVLDKWRSTKSVVTSLTARNCLYVLPNIAHAVEAVI